ncbi:MoaD/ThiS family protein [Lysinibacillus sp. NPDC093688]|uniref:MoaD/ThiS family protein n=1 Tax=Lysinibacillus sp. NPDC093688 TaxID=3390577 RepID=UPI003CFE453F
MALIKISGPLIGQTSADITWNIKKAQTNELVSFLKEAFPTSYTRIINNTDEFKPFINVYVNKLPISLTEESVFLEGDEVLIVGSIAGG